MIQIIILSIISGSSQTQLTHRKAYLRSATLTPNRPVKTSIGTRAVPKLGGAFSTTLAHDEDGGGSRDASIFFEDIMSTIVPEKMVSIYSRVPLKGGREWSAIVASNTLFIKVPDTVDWEGNGFGFKECVVAVMELAEEVLGCRDLVVCLQKSREDLTSILRTFMFVGFEIVHPTVYNFGENYVLVGAKL